MGGYGMRSLKEAYLGSYKILGLNLRVGKWYKVFVNGNTSFWLVRFYGVNDNEIFLHKGITYCVKSQFDVTEYPSTNGIYHGLCYVNLISGIESVGLDYIRSYGIEC
jgi:hypothetical protein